MGSTSPSTGKLQLRKDGTVKCPSCKTVVSPDLSSNLLPKHNDVNRGHLCLESNREFIFNPWVPPKRKKRDNRLALLKAPDSVLTDEERARKKRILANVEKYKIRDPETRRYHYKQEQAKKDSEKRAAIKRAEARERRREEAAERRREARLSDSYALYAHDSFGQSDDGFEPHERMRGFRGGLPGMGKRR
ncbi:hypothetical protein [uncultured Corynebacterium sp.]|uniref:hypothetical protein n=1 Tax=uncultured Corynebacterium sp. TaxID=159447 RepID=UPI00261E2AB6|nr:hypothetical protein [uncultured Corynebacterium sp.]